MGAKSPENNETVETHQEIGEITKKETAKLNNEVQENNKHHSFEELKYSEKNESMKKFMDGMSFYIDEKLNKLNLGNLQKENIKNALFGNISSKINKIGNIDNNKQNIFNKIGNIIGNITSNETKKESKDEIIILLQSLGIEDIFKKIDEKINNIKNNYSNNDFKTLKKSLLILSPDITGNNEKEVFDKIQKNITTLSGKFAKWSELLDGVIDKSNKVEKLGFGNPLKELMKYLKENFPILGTFLAMFFGGIETNGNSKKDKSISNLQKFIDNKDKSPLNKIEENKNYKNKEKLNSEKLKPFYEYLDLEGIKYGEEKSEFWEEFLTGLNKDGNNINPKTKKIRELFLEKLDGKKLEDFNIEELIKNLNSLPKLADQKEKEEIEKENKEKIQKINDLKEKKKHATNEDKKEIENQIKQIEKTKKYSFKENLLRGKVEINGELKDISIENNNIKIGKNLYSISIVGTGLGSLAGNVFESIELNNGQLTVVAHGETVNYPIEKAIPLLKELINNGGITNKPIKGKPATLSITKKA